MAKTFFLGAFGDPGHAFPVIALGRALRTRGHRVIVETWQRWQELVEDERLEFRSAREYGPVPGREHPYKPYQAAAVAANDMLGELRKLAPDVVVHDVLTLAPALAAERIDVPFATLVPHLYHGLIPGLPPFSSGLMPPRTRAGGAAWRAATPLLRRGSGRGIADLNRARAAVGLATTDRPHMASGKALMMVGTLPQLEAGRELPGFVRVVGPLQWEPPFEATTPPAGEGPLVVVAPSTAKDPEHRMLRAALKGLGDLPLRVLATTNRRPLHDPPPPAPNTKLVDWISYAQTMPGADVVVTHGGHGTVMRALTAGAPVVMVPVAGDMFETAARAEWAGVGVRIGHRMLSAASLAAAVERVVADRQYGRRTRKLAEWSSRNDGAQNAARALEEYAAH